MVDPGFRLLLRVRFVDKPTPPRPPRPPRQRPLPRPLPRLRGAPGRSDGPRRPRPPSRRRRGAPIARRYHRRAAPRDVSAGDAARLFTASRILDVCRSCVQLPRESAPLHMTCLPARGRLRGLAAMRDAISGVRPSTSFLCSTPSSAGEAKRFCDRSGTSNFNEPGDRAQ